ncbi:hypothetical protein L218DRAFT_1002413 [Marasmius fiardii PR-910]|nr:hypothetical protein L218DRAFT_1002413 [Marasmius fiardii PR-910]
MPDTKSIVEPKHSPAVKVGGRRLSTTSRPKAHAEEPTTVSSGPAENTQTTSTSEVDDYPRPVAQTDNNGGHEHAHHSYEDESPLKKEMNKHKHDFNRDMYNNQPTRDYQVASKGAGYGAGGRIAQPSSGRIGI